MADTDTPDPGFVNDRQFEHMLWQEMRAETRDSMKALNVEPWIITMLMMISLAASKLPWWHVEGVALGLVLGLSAPFVMAHRGVLVHRPSDAVRYIETLLRVQGWENFFKSRLFWGKLLLVPLSLSASIPITFMFWWVNNQWYLHTQSGNTWWVCWLVFVGGMVTIPVSSKLATK